ncbi:ELM2 domain-containing protein [Ditylenchus destructor]|uniref:ELM2 domain-containing protein n=1 Tax=Ditylenchus destructor TaxID=166010 RepID=A0AAD4R984_9BILA|nr:ELM2 domain-containing protein [Ditylenchus destructor]
MPLLSESGTITGSSINTTLKTEVPNNRYPLRRTRSVDRIYEKEEKNLSVEEEPEIRIGDAYQANVPDWYGTQTDQIDEEQYAKLFNNVVWEPKPGLDEAEVERYWKDAKSNGIKYDQAMHLLYKSNYDFIQARNLWADYIPRNEKFVIGGRRIDDMTVLQLKEELKKRCLRNPGKTLDELRKRLKHLVIESGDLKILPPRSDSQNDNEDTYLDIVFFTEGNTNVNENSTCSYENLTLHQANLQDNRTHASIVDDHQISAIGKHSRNDSTNNKCSICYNSGHTNVNCPFRDDSD